MPRFDITQYSTVAERIEAFWAKYPDGRIHTELVDEGFLDGCVNCKFPTPSVFVNEDDLLFCRKCRTSGEDGVLV